MSLPIIPKKHFEFKSKHLPGGKVTLSPFTVGMENLLIQVRDSEQEFEKMQAIKQVVQYCIQNSNISAGLLPLFVVEEMFVHLRQNSMGETIEQEYQCNAEKESGEVCGTKMQIQLDLRDFKLVEPEGHTNVIMISDPIGVKFRYPSIDLLEDFGASTEDESQTIISCIDSIFDGDNVYKASESSREDLEAFWNQFTLVQKREVYDKFFNTMPHLQYRKQFTCKGCGHIHTLAFDSVQEVFQ